VGFSSGFHPGELSGFIFERFRKSLRRQDRWLSIAEASRPCCLKLNLGSGSSVLPGWTNLDPRRVHPSIVRWSFDELIPFGDNKADVVFTSHVFNYVDESRYVECLLDIWRVLRPGGVLRLSEDRTDNGYIWRRPGRKHATGVLRSLPTREKIERALRAVGFTIFEVSDETTVSPHTDVLLGNSRERRYRLGHKFYLEAVKLIHIPHLGRTVDFDPRAPKRRGRYRLPEVSG
jgi:SAM-dependent methyltransferase